GANSWAGTGPAAHASPMMASATTAYAATRTFVMVSAPCASMIDPSPYPTRAAMTDGGRPDDTHLPGVRLAGGLLAGAQIAGCAASPRHPRLLMRNHRNEPQGRSLPN